MAKKAAEQESTGTPKNAERLVNVQANHLIVLALKDIDNLVTDKLKSADAQVAELKASRQSSKTFASYRELNALRVFTEEMRALQGQLRKQLGSVRTRQKSLTADSAA